MITAALIAIIAALVMGGTAGLLMVPDIEKKVKKLGKNEPRIKRILAAISSVEQAYKVYLKKLKGYDKQVALLMDNRLTSREELSAVFTASLEAYRQVQINWIHGRLCLVDNLTLEEFTDILDPDSKATAKREATILKPYEKIIKEIDKGLGDILTISIEKIEQSEQQQKVSAAIQGFKNAIELFLKEFVEWNVRDNAVIKDYRSTEAQFLEMLEDINLRRVEMYQAFIDLYLHLSASITEKEWKAAASALKKLAVKR